MKFSRISSLASAYWSTMKRPLSAKGRPHGLPGELIVSLTSYPARFNVLGLTLKSILQQTVAPDRVVLCITHDDFEYLPPSVTSLQRHGLEIMKSSHHRSYNKILPALEKYPKAFIITADDDLFYEPIWIESIVSAYDSKRPSIVCRRAHRPRYDPIGGYLSYSDWEDEVLLGAGNYVNDIVPTGVGGILYYPGCLSPQVNDKAAIVELCPYADDLWLYWMGRMNGVEYQQVGGEFKQVTWPSSQKSSLRDENVVAGGNDRQLLAIATRFPRLAG